MEVNFSEVKCVNYFMLGENFEINILNGFIWCYVFSFCFIFWFFIYRDYRLLFFVWLIIGVKYNENIYFWVCFVFFLFCLRKLKYIIFVNLILEDYSRAVILVYKSFIVK